MDVHKGRKRQKAGGEIGVKDAAGDPRPGNEESNSSRDQSQEVSRKLPVGIASSARFARLVVACDPQILCGMQHRQNAATVAGLRHLVPTEEFDHRGQQEPQELRDRQRQRREDRPQAAAPRQGNQRPSTCA